MMDAVHSLHLIETERETYKKKKKKKKPSACKILELNQSTLHLTNPLLEQRLPSSTTRDTRVGVRVSAPVRFLINSELACPESS